MGQDTKLQRTWMARCNKCSTPRLIPAGTAVSMWQGRPSVRCPECNGSMHAKILKGRVTDTPCDARCEGATGHICECSCGGKNHGVSHAA